jgi:hypothetical protein
MESLPLTAKLTHLQDLYELELGKPAKIAHKLSEKVLAPISIERTNVQLANSLFHESTIAALEFYARDGNDGKREWAETARFLTLIRRWWDTVNVKTPKLGLKKRSSQMQPITHNNQENFLFLIKFADWLQRWKEECKKNMCRGLTNETFLATSQTTAALAELSQYLLHKKGFHYVLLGQFQSDPIERRFGWYRQLAGSNYFVSVCQIIKAEKSIRVKALLKFSRIPLESVRAAFEELEAENNQTREDMHVFLSLLNLDKLEVKCENLEDKNIMFFIMGFIARSLSKVLRCSGCVKLVKEDKELPALQVANEEEEEGYE